MKAENLIKATFSERSTRLPTIWEISQDFVLENDWQSKEMLNSFAVRTKYTKHSFCILSDEFCKSVVVMCDDLGLSVIVELCSGPGWLSFWLKRYGLNVVATIDNGSWKGMEPHLGHVTQGDAIEFTKNHSEIDLFILSWPYMNDTAYRIWKNMQSGQVLLYIGESNGGCTANDEFFDAVHGKRVRDKWHLSKSFVSFFGIHDRPILYKK